jgi:hypothetical protein
MATDAEQVKQVIAIYTIIEDNGGGLHLCILTDAGRETCTHVFSDWEYDPANLVASLAALDAGETDVDDWENAQPNPQSLYERLTDDEMRRNGGTKIIADENGPIAVERMGVSGVSVFYPGHED